MHHRYGMADGKNVGFKPRVNSKVAMGYKNNPLSCVDWFHGLLQAENNSLKGFLQSVELGTTNGRPFQGRVTLYIIHLFTL